MAKKETRERVKDTYLSEAEHQPNVVKDLLKAHTAISKIVGFRNTLTPKEAPALKTRIRKVGSIDKKYNGSDEFAVDVIRGSIRSLAKKYDMNREDTIAALRKGHAFMLPGQDNFYIMPTRLPVAGE